jgi:hypothetical protein
MEQLNLYDPWGTLFFVPAIVSFLLALQWGGSKYAWNSGRIIALLIVFGVLICVFIGIQFWRQDHATVPPRIFRKRTVWSGALWSFTISGSFYILNFYVRIRILAPSIPLF